MARVCTGNAACPGFYGFGRQVLCSEGRARRGVALRGALVKVEGVGWEAEESAKAVQHNGTFPVAAL